MNPAVKSKTNMAFKRLSALGNQTSVRKNRMPKCVQQGILKIANWIKRD